MGVPADLSFAACPWCRRGLSGCISLVDDEGPCVGDWGVCGTCGAILVVEAHDVRAPLAGEIVTMLCTAKAKFDLLIRAQVQIRDQVLGGAELPPPARIN